MRWYINIRPQNKDKQIQILSNDSFGYDPSSNEAISAKDKKLLTKKL